MTIKNIIDKNGISILYVFFVLFSVQFFLYFFDMSQLLYGNHDAFSGWTLFPFRAHHALIGVPIYSVLLSYGEVLPVVTNIVFYISISLCAILFFMILGFPGSSRNYILAGSFLTVNPSFLSIFYYKYLLVPYSIAPLLVLFGLLSLSLSLSLSLNIKRKFLGGILGAFAIFCGLNGYAAALTLIPVVLFLWLFMQLKAWDGSKGQFTVMFFDSCKVIAWTGLGVITFLVCQKIVVALGFSPEGDYHQSHFSISEFLENAPATISFAFKHLWATQPFMPIEYKLLLIVVLVLGFCVGIYESQRQTSNFPAKMLKITLGLLCVFCAIVSCKLPALLNPNARAEMYELRFSIYGIPYIYAFAIMLLLHARRPFHNLAVIMAIVCICFGFFCSAHAQRVWKMGYEKELSMYTRVVERVVTHENYDNSVKYTYWQMGLKNFRKELYNKKYDYPARELLDYPLMAHWYPQRVLQGIEPALNIKQALDVQGWGGHGKGFASSLELQKKYKSAIDKMKVWPHVDSVLVIDDVIIVAIDPAILKKYQNISQ